MFFKRSPKKAFKEDDELLILYKESGEIVWLGELYERYMHLIFGLCIKYLKNQDDSKDMTMQIFEKLAIELKRQEVKNFKSWLHVLARNECLMLLRSRSYKAEKEKIDLDDGGEFMENSFPLHPEDEDKLEADLQQMEMAVETLPPEQKICIKLFYLEQRCYKEIADQTGFDIKKVKSYIQNGKRNLKIYLQSINEDP